MSLHDSIIIVLHCNLQKVLSIWQTKLCSLDSKIVDVTSSFCDASLPYVLSSVKGKSKDVKCPKPTVDVTSVLVILPPDTTKDQVS